MGQVHEARRGATVAWASLRSPRPFIFSAVYSVSVVVIMRRRSRRQTMTAAPPSELQNKVAMHQNNLAAAAAPRANIMPPAHAAGGQGEDPALA